MSPRNMFGLAFSAGAAAILLIVTGLVGWQPPANLNLAEASWRRGVWTGGVIWSQVVLGIVFLDEYMIAPDLRFRLMIV
jgi:hypothetical protein